MKNRSHFDQTRGNSQDRRRNGDKLLGFPQFNRLFAERDKFFEACVFQALSDKTEERPVLGSPANFHWIESEIAGVDSAENVATRLLSTPSRISIMRTVCRPKRRFREGGKSSYVKPFSLSSFLRSDSRSFPCMKRARVRTRCEPSTISARPSLPSTSARNSSGIGNPIRTDSMKRDWCSSGQVRSR